MAKKKEPKIDTAKGSGLGHSPFAALAGLAAPPAPVEEAPADEAPAPGAGPRFPHKVVVRREKKGRGGKTVTRIQGIPEAEREALAARLKKALGCGAAVEGEDLVLLGSLVDRAADWLEAEGAKRVSRSA
ncbi:MAG: translation initiation factor [Myxococcales bacterium]|nr:translation initiation factor [Myxococcales bacterium]